jgi:dipeptidyl aminopeptidase/acylaminoacyl peptidase
MCMQGGAEIEERQLTNEPHPHPQLKGLQRKIIQYKRSDGVGLNGELFLPPRYDAARDGSLPCILWAYPRCDSPQK